MQATVEISTSGKRELVVVTAGLRVRQRVVGASGPSQGGELTRAQLHCVPVK